MRKVLITIVAICILTSVGIFVVDKTNPIKKTEAQTISIDWQGKSKVETTTPYSVSFQSVAYEENNIPDTFAVPDGYNGVFIETIDTNLTNYAAPKLDGSSVITKNDFDIISLSDSDAWKFLSDDYFSGYPESSFKNTEEILNAIYNKYATTINVKAWYWEDPYDETNMSKVTVTLQLTVHSKLKSLWEHIFNDIYNQSSKPVININDSGMGTWAIRGKNHNPNNTLSAHALGTAIDINPSTASFNIGGYWYGNAYGQRVLDASTWSQLPECHEKYQVLYIDCPVVQVFKSYGFYWGGDWSDTKDNMHLSFLGDSCGRNKGYSNYLQYRRK